jgi:hypothetical protein
MFFTFTLPELNCLRNGMSFPISYSGTKIITLSLNVPSYTLKLNIHVKCFGKKKKLYRLAKNSKLLLTERCKNPLSSLPVKKCKTKINNSTVSHLRPIVKRDRLYPETEILVVTAKVKHGKKIHGKHINRCERGEELESRNKTVN